MSEGTLIALGLFLCAWVWWLEVRVSRLSEERDVLCDALIGVASGRLKITVSQDRSVDIKPVE